MREIDKLLNYIIQNQDKLIQDAGVHDTSIYNNRVKDNNLNFVDELPCNETEIDSWSDPSEINFKISSPQDPSLIPPNNEEEVPEHIKEMNIQIMLDSLIESGIIVEYEIDGETYYKLKN